MTTEWTEVTLECMDCYDTIVARSLPEAVMKAIDHEHSCERRRGHRKWEMKGASYRFGSI